jgi:uncharacterized membrane protein YbhN (UPF0104 family)
VAAEVSPRRRLVQRGLPGLVSVGALAWLLASFDLRAIVAALDGRVAEVLLPALVAYGAATLVLEALSIRRLVPSAPASFTLGTAARIKSASYLLGIIHMTLGGAGLAVLLRQRTGLALAECAGVVLLIMLTDLLITLVSGALGAALSQSAASALPVGAIALFAAGLVFGLGILRAPGSLGPLERIRSLPVFLSLRHTPLARLVELLLLRCVFVACFIAIGGAGFAAFDIPAEPPRVVVGMTVLAVVAALPIAVSGLGTGQVAALYLFRDLAPPETIIAMSLVLSFGLISLRLVMGLVFAREFARQALAQTREAA